MLAIQALCVFEALGDAFLERLSDFLRETENCAELGVECPPPQDTLVFARELAWNTWTQRKTLDERLERVAAHWALNRMPPVDRNVLRLGLHELLEHPETPPQVVINEAIELARAFGDSESPAFVNGLLDALRRDLLPASVTENTAPSQNEAGSTSEREVDPTPAPLPAVENAAGLDLNEGRDGAV